jgi:hypothetical protein
MTCLPDRRIATCVGAAAAAIAGMLSACPALAQVRVVIEGGVVVLGGGREAAGPAEVAPPVGAIGETAIGDPWWDQAGGEPAAVAEPAADVQERGRRQAQARLTAVRRSRGMQILRLELSRVRAACPELAVAARTKLVAAGREAVEGQAAGRTPLVGGVELALEQALQEHAGSLAAKAYTLQLEACAARRQQAALAVLVEVIDQDAVLDDEARQRLADALRQHWRPEWEAVVTTAARRRLGVSSLPAGVADATAAALDADAFTVWRRRAEEGRR